MEDDFWWKTAFNEDGVQWKTTFDGRQSLREDDLFE